MGPGAERRCMGRQINSQYNILFHKRSSKRIRMQKAALLVVICDMRTWRPLPRQHY